MKKKAIEKIPYLKLSSVICKKDVKYVGVTAVKVIGHEKHLFLEVYQNKKTSMETPLVRIVVTKKDFGTYFPKDESWSKQKIKTDGGCGRLIWTLPEESRDTWENQKKKNVLQSEDDMRRIKNFSKTRAWDEDRWWDYIMKKQDDITITARRKTEERKYERRQQALKERIRNTKPLPEKKILKTADDVYFRNKHYLYYKKRGSMVQIACSKCGGVTDARWKPGESYESQFMGRVEEPREGNIGRCKLCGASGIYKCQGKVKGSHERIIHLFLGQKYKEKGIVMRYLEISKKWILEIVVGENGDEMHGAYEELSGVEIARTYLAPGENTQTDFHKHSWYSGEDYWDDCNLYGNANITIHPAPILSETYQELQGTAYQYCALKEYAAAVRKTDTRMYLQRYMETPQIEMLTKMGLTDVVTELVNCRYGIVTDQDATRPDEFLGIRKERVKQLIRAKGNIHMLQIMKAEKRLQRIWTEEQIEKLAELELTGGQIEMATRYINLQKLLNHIAKYAGCQYGTLCGMSSEQLKQTARTYMDYLEMRLSLGYDLNNTVYQFPRDLKDAHDRMVAEANKDKADKRLKEAERRFPNIRSEYRKLRNEYLFEDDSYIIRPARSASEIVMEGRTLHHCVGGDNYLRKHNEGESYILMLRFKIAPEEPYITVEIESRRNRILQWYGNKDCKPDKKNMQKWLGNYTEQLRDKKKMQKQTA